MGRHCEYALARNDGTVNHASGGNEKNSNPVKNLFTVLDYSGPRPAMRGAGSLYTPPHFALAKLPLRQAVALGGWVRSTLTGALLKIRYLPIYSFTPQKAFTLAEGATHVETSAGKCAHAFTLAEVLITLGIIGIVAAMTLPALTTKYRKQEVSARLKKYYTVMNQAIMMSENDNGDMRFWVFPTDYTTDGVRDHVKSANLSEQFFNTYLKKYLSYYSYEKGLNTSDETDGSTVFKSNRIIFHDGTIAYLNVGSCFDTVFDTNGDKKPNEFGIDRFYFYICPYKSSLKSNPNEKFSTSAELAKNHQSREQAYNLCKSNKRFCTRLIQMDNWEIRNDYPYKI